MRDDKGRFTEGNPGGPGRPPRPTEAAYLRATSAGVTLEDWTEIVNRAVQDAKAGDGAARAFLAKYLLGSPVVSTPSLVKAHALELAEVDEVGKEADWQKTVSRF